MNQLLYSIVYMRYSQLIDEVLTVYTGLDQHLTSVAKQNGLSCPQFCSRCCLKPDIEASPIEFLPLAAYLYKTNQVDEFLAKLDGNEDGICVNYNADASQRGEWGCQNYLYRGLIGRLFGYGFRLNREGIPGLVTCKIMKENLPAAIAKANQYAEARPDEVPLFRNYFMQLYAIDPEMAVEQLPINDAIRVAIEKLFFYFVERDENQDAETDERK